MKKFPEPILGILFVAFSLLIFLSLVSYTPHDISWMSAPLNGIRHNLVGVVGGYLAFGLFFVFGIAGYFIPFYFFSLGLDRLQIVRFQGISQRKTINVLSFFFLLIFLPALIGVFFHDSTLMFEKGGLLGYTVAQFLRTYLGFWGSFLSLGIVTIVSSILLFGCFLIDISQVVKSISLKLLAGTQKLYQRKKESRRTPLIERAGQKEVKAPLKEKAPQIKIYTPRQIQTQQPLAPSSSEPGRGALLSKDELKKKSAGRDTKDLPPFDSKKYEQPTIDLLKPPPALDVREVKEDIKGNIKNLEETLSDFGVMARVVSVQKGPVVTMYEIEPSAGVKIQRITTLADDIALAMKSSSVRIVAPLPGRGTVGVEVPNEKKHVVYLREVLEEKHFIQSPSKLTLAVGKDVKGDPIVADLKDMPHLLIAGATGAGKTVCVNSIISSVLFKAKPDEVKFILIDPKMVELAPFSGIPHLISPLLSDAKKAFGALNWAVEEMEARYRLLAEEGVRNIDMYNKKETRLPYILIVIDELADLMVVARDNIETAIQRLAQLSRAVGIHLILATQRPSVDVITGVIKANFPARISFKVSSKVDSRTVLDANGADKLLGKGDLLFLKPGAVRLIRAQGSYIDDEDLEALTDSIKKQGAPVYEERIAQLQQRSQVRLEEDELFYEAVKIVLLSRQASASLLQRRLRVGYTRAARLLDLMENGGIVGPFQGSKAREILVDPHDYLKEKGLV